MATIQDSLADPAVLEEGAGVTITQASPGDPVVISSSAAAPDASDVTVTPTGGISATNAQAALAEVDSEKAAKASNLSDLASASTARTNLGLGTAATKDVPASGDASSGQVVLGNDSRLGGGGGGGASVLDDLTDVDTTGVADGDTIVYDSGTSSWLPAAPSGGGGGGTGDASWTNATYAGTWGSYGSPYAAAGYRKDGQGFVHLRGLVAGGSGTIFTLPAGYRRGAKGSYNTFNNVGTGTIDVNTNGTVTLAAGGSSYASLDGITFYAEA